MKKTLLILCAALSLTACKAHLPPPELNTINSEINSFKYIADKAGNDHWAQPKEFYARGGGDCEDYAIAKYFKVKETIPDSDVEILLVLDYYKNVHHAVLLVNNQWVLDNQEKEIMTVGSQRFHNRYNILAITNNRKEAKNVAAGK